MVCIYVHNISCVRLIRDHFNLTHLQYADMSPILIPQGYTKSYLDGNDALVFLLIIDTHEQFTSCVLILFTLIYSNS